MSNTQKKQSFIHGTMLLAIATAIVKVFGALYKIPLNAIINEEGFGYYSTAYDIYTVLLMISTAGLPVAMSRLISQANSLGHYRQMRKIYRVSRAIFLTLGLVGSVLMTVFCRQLAAFQKQPDAWAAIGALGPCCFLVCLMSTYRGFFQGQSNMFPTSISQIIEAVFKLVVGIVAAVLVKIYTGSVALAAGAAIFGVTMSCLASSVYLNSCFRKSYADLPDSPEDTIAAKDIAKCLLAIAIPITIGSAGLQILTVLDTKIYMTQLLGFLTQKQADVQRGIYSMAITILNMPCAFVTPITISAIPAITAQLTVGNTAAARATEESAARITALIAMPCAFGLTLLAQPVTALLGGYQGENLVLATRMMTILGIGVIFNPLVLLTNAIMQARGHERLPVINMFVGGGLKLILVYVLTGNPSIGIVGAAAANLMCYISITILNLFTLRRVFKDPPAILRNMIRAFAAAAVMGVFVFGAWKLLVMLLGADMNRIIACAVPILVGGIVYLLAAVKFKAITREDCLLLPKGDKIATFLHL